MTDVAFCCFQAARINLIIATWWKWWICASIPTSNRNAAKVAENDCEGTPDPTVSRDQHTDRNSVVHITHKLLEAVITPLSEVTSLRSVATQTVPSLTMIRRSPEGAEDLTRDETLSMVVDIVGRIQDRLEKEWSGVSVWFLWVVLEWKFVCKAGNGEVKRQQTCRIKYTCT